MITELLSFHTLTHKKTKNKNVQAEQRALLARTKKKERNPDDDIWYLYDDKWWYVCGKSETWETCVRCFSLSCISAAALALSHWLCNRSGVWSWGRGIRDAAVSTHLLCDTNPHTCKRTCRRVARPTTLRETVSPYQKQVVPITPCFHLWFTHMQMYMLPLLLDKLCLHTSAPAPTISPLHTCRTVRRTKQAAHVEVIFKERERERALLPGAPWQKQVDGAPRPSPVRVWSAG